MTAPHAPTDITGYRNLSPDEVAQINEIKALAAHCGAMVEKMRRKPGQVVNQTVEAERPLDQRCVSIAATELQTGFMWLIRAVAQPSTF